MLLLTVGCLLAVPSAGLALPDGPPGVSAPVSAWEELAKITPDDAHEEGPYPNLTESHAFVTFGSSLAVGGDTLAVGTAFDWHEAPQWVYIFKRATDGSWVQTAKLTPPAGDRWGGFGFSLAIDESGSRLLVGDPGLDRNGTEDVGAVYVYERSSSGVWSLSTTLTAPTASAEGSMFGFSVAVEGETLVVGEPGVSTVSVFEPDAARNWTRVAHFREPGSVLGFTVDVAGSTIASGAVKETTAAGPIDGAIHIYERLGGTWSQTEHLIPPRPAVGTYGEDFGGAIALSGDGRFLVTGSVWDDRVASEISVEPVFKTTNTGSAFLYERSGEGWTHVTSLANPDRGPRERFGQDVDIADDGSFVVVSANHHPYGGRSGTAYVYRPIAGEWQQSAQLRGSDTGPGDYFGDEVEIRQSSILVSAPFDDNRRDGTPWPLDDEGDLAPFGNDQGEDAGSVYEFAPRASSSGLGGLGS